MSDLLQRLQEAVADRYRIEREIGRGGTATVFLAEDLKLPRRVAIKVLDPVIGAAVSHERFLREIRTVSGLTHPHILPLYDSGSGGGLLYFVMPYVEGESLRQRLARERQLPVGDALRITGEVAEALEHAHRAGVIHRDIKPENVLLESGHAVVADFGLAHALGSVEPTRLTTSGIMVGTPTYMSPEQATDGGRVDGRSDQYSLACLLYELLAGEPPFVGATTQSVIHQHLTVAARPVTDLRPSVPGSVRDAIARTLAKAPADRFASIAEFAAAIAGDATPAAAGNGPPDAAAMAVAIESGPTLEMARTPAARLARSLRRPFALALGVVALAVVAYVTWRYRAISPPPTPAKKGWILVAELDGPPADPSLARAAREIVSAALDQSPIVAVVPREQIQVALQQAGKPDSTRVTAELARELAYRTTVRTVLEGNIVRLGDRYTVTLRATDVEQGRQVASFTEVARSEDALVLTLTGMARRVREKLGESPQSLRTTRPGEWPVATHSFEAYRRWAEAMRLYNQGDYVGALKLNREAVAIDPDFGVGWASLGFAYIPAGKLDSAVLGMEEASRHPQSLTPAYRLLNEGRIAWLRGDDRNAMETFERVTRLYPKSVEGGFAFNYEQIMFESQGRLQDAFEAYTGSDQGDAIGRTQLEWYLRSRLRIAMGEAAEARSEVAALHGRYRSLMELNLALAAKDWSRADSLATLYERTPGTEVGLLVSSAVTRAQVAAVAGEVSAAEAHLRRAEKLQHEKGNPALATRTPRVRVLLALMSSRPVPRPEPWLEHDTTTSALITRAYVAAASGDVALAHGLLSRLRARSTTRLGAHGSTPEFIEAWIAARAGRWSDVVRLIAQPAREGSDRGLQTTMAPCSDRAGTPAERWLVAQAYERLDQPDSAAAFYLRMLGPDEPGLNLIGLVHLFSHQRLVLLHARMGRLEDAEQRLAILERDVTRPDPDIRQLLDDARAAVSSARAARSAHTLGH